MLPNEENVVITEQFKPKGNLDKHFWELWDHTQFPMLKILQSKLDLTWINLFVRTDVSDNEHCRNKAWSSLRDVSLIDF